MTTKARAGIPLPRNKRAESVRLLRVWLERYKTDLIKHGLKGYAGYAVRAVANDRV